MDRVELRVRVGLLQAERVEVGDQVATDAVHVDQLLHRNDLLEPFDRAGRRAVVLRPARRLVRNGEALEDLVVEAVGADEEVVHRGEHLAALRALDDAVVVGARERHDLPDAQLGQRLRIGALVLGRVDDRADADDHALSGHEARHRVHRADRAGVGDRHRRAAQVVRSELVVARATHEVFVRGVEAREVEGVGLLDVGDDQRARAVGLLEVDREPEVDVFVVHDARLAVDEPEARVHRPDLAQRAAGPRTRSGA